VTRPSPGGLNSWETQQVLRSLVGADIVGFDVVGLCPRADTSDLTSIVAVNIVHEILAAVADTREGSRVSLIGGSVGRTSA
jgi:arginase family enzyme